jgi:hypothetical protein
MTMFKWNKTGGAALFSVAMIGGVYAQAKPEPAKPAASAPAAPAKPASARSAAAKPDAAALLNKAARQPMLVERITKSYTLVSQNVLGPRSKRQMDDAVQEFERALKELQTTAPTADIKENYELLEQLWGEYRDLTKQANNAERNKLLAEQNEEVVWISQKGANMLAEHAKAMRSSELIAAAGDVRVLTQRIAKLYLFRAGGIRSQVIEEDLKTAEKQYRADIEKLLKAPQNTPQIASELQLAETQYVFLKQAIERLNQNRASKVELENVAKACDNILEVMERVTKLYEGLKA